ncbi:MAG: SMC-Scp complex subunit ScpB [Candidatus Aminicenantaceae bacterium]
MNNNIKEIIESMIFISKEPLSQEKIKNVLNEFPEKEIEQAINILLESYSTNERGIQIIRLGGGYLFSTKPEYDKWIRRLLNIEKKNKLSPAALETLSAVAYHQPVTLAEVSAIRGVDSSHTIKVLLQKKLIKITGRKKSPGKPLIYRTSHKFLTYFGLDNIKDLPSQEEISKIMDDENDQTSNT